MIVFVVCSDWVLIAALVALVSAAVLLIIVVILVYVICRLVKFTALS